VAVTVSIEGPAWALETLRRVARGFNFSGGIRRSVKQRIYGVDFSGSQAAGDKIWLASAVLSGETLFVEGCYPARELPNSGRERDRCYPALVDFIETSPDAALGLDFPFGVPAEVTEHQEWTAFVSTFADIYDSPLGLHETCKATGAATPGDGVEYRRSTDEAADAPFCPYNWRIKHQTYHGIADLLAPLVADDSARALPMQSPRETKAWVLEVCPSSTLKALGLPRTGYKDTSDSAELRRREIVEQLEEGSVVVTESVRETAIGDPEGDALDSVIASMATAAAVREQPDVDSVDAEGYIYV
jgi:hypothetical protein